jgi:HipA-like protein
MCVKCKMRPADPEGADMHLKNWSLLYPDRRTPVLSPAYDFVATLAYIPNDDLALTFGGSRSLAEITTGQMRHFADAARILASPLWQIAVETAARTIAEWKAVPRHNSNRPKITPNRMPGCAAGSISRLVSATTWMRYAPSSKSPQ